MVAQAGRNSPGMLVHIVRTRSTVISTPQSQLHAYTVAVDDKKSFRSFGSNGFLSTFPLPYFYTNRQEWASLYFPPNCPYQPLTRNLPPQLSSWLSNYILFGIKKNSALKNIKTLH